MDIEFHYYITYIIARRAGFKPDNAYLIAYTSQYTDDNNTIYNINEGSSDAYSNYISQTINIFKPQMELMRIYPVFHFLPGTLNEISVDSGRRSDGKLHLLNTIPNSLNSKKVIAESFTSKNLYRIGIATHTYVDTFAHQNFVGANDGFNDMAGPLESLTPSVGHADAQHLPDIPNKLWQDRRLVTSHVSIDNRKCFLDAAGCLFDNYSSYLRTNNDRNAMLGDIANAIGNETNGQSQRIENYKNIIGTEFIEYKKQAWFDEAVDFTNVSGTHGSGTSETRWIWRNHYKTSHWFQFQEALKAHQDYVLLNIVRPIYETMEQTTW